MTDIGEARHQLPPGSMLQNGKYQIVRTLGQGGFGITYLALHDTFGEVALKELFLSAPNIYCTRDALHDGVGRGVVPNRADLFETFKQRFREEARMLYRLRKIAGVVKVHDFFDENGTVYLPMEYLKGEKLQDYVQARGRLSVGEGMGILRSMAQTLRSVHEQGVLHRDIKPTNIIIGDGHEVTLIDFGIAREYIDDATEHTTYHTPGYAPPEQKIANLRLGPYSDVYSLGGTAYFMFTGAAPQSSDERHIEEYLPPDSLVPELPALLVRAINHALELKPNARFQSVGALLDAVSDVSEQVQQLSVPVSTGAPVRRRPVAPTIPASSYETSLHRTDAKEPMPNNDLTVVAPGSQRVGTHFLRWMAVGGGLLAVTVLLFWRITAPDFDKETPVPTLAAPLPLPDSAGEATNVPPAVEQTDASDTLYFEQHKDKVSRLVKGEWRAESARLQFGDYSARVDGRDEGFHWSLGLRKGGFLLLIEDEGYVANRVFRITGPFSVDSARLELLLGNPPQPSAQPVTFHKATRRR